MSTVTQTDANIVERIEKAAERVQKARAAAIHCWAERGQR
jgi:hypothetical protein